MMPTFEEQVLQDVSNDILRRIQYASFRKLTCSDCDEVFYRWMDELHVECPNCKARGVAIGEIILH